MDLRRGVWMAVNGFEGWAVIGSVVRGDEGMVHIQPVSTISRKLARVFKPVEEEDVAPKVDTGRRFEVQIRLGGPQQNDQLHMDMAIYEENLDNGVVFREFHPQHDDGFECEVILGQDFIEKFHVDCPKGYMESTSGFFGRYNVMDIMPEFPCFVKDFSTTDYTVDDDSRLILLLDMDSFEVQVHQKEKDKGKPLIIANAYNIILSVSPEAKLEGINRDMNVSDARKKFPRLLVTYVPTRKDGIRPNTMIAKVESQKIYDAVKKILRQDYGQEGTDYILQYNSNDEFYIDLTTFSHKWEQSERSKDWCWMNRRNVEHVLPKVYFYGGSLEEVPDEDYLSRRMEAVGEKERNGGLSTFMETREKRMLFGASIAVDIVNKVFKETGYQSSAGVAANKVMAKIASGVHKPASITVASPLGFKNFCSRVKMEDVPLLGGDKIGKAVKEKWDIATISDANDRVTFRELSNLTVSGRKLGDNNAYKILNNLHGVCFDPVQPKEYPETCSLDYNCHGKNFTPIELLTRLEYACEEFAEKLDFEKVHHSRLFQKLKMKITGGTKDKKTKGTSFATSEFDPGQSDIDSSSVYNHFLVSMIPKQKDWPEQSAIRGITLVASDYVRLPTHRRGLTRLTARPA